MGYQGLSGAPTVFPTSRSAAGKRSTRSARPCKYGPRGEDGLCPKKPKSGRRRASSSSRAKRETARAVLGSLPQRERERERKPTKRERAAERKLETLAVNTTTRAVQRGLGKAANSPAGQKALGAAVKTAAYLSTPVTALSGGAAAGAVGLAIAAGVGSFLITSKILKGIRDRKEQRQQAAYEAAHQMRLTRLDAEKRLGRPLTVAELQKIKKAFDLTNLMQKAGL